MIERILSKLNSIPADKVAHFTVGVILFAVLLPFLGGMYSVVAVAIVGFAKEFYDSLHKESHTPDVWDAVATAAGGFLGFYCSTF